MEWEEVGNGKSSKWLVCGHERVLCILSVGDKLGCNAENLQVQILPDVALIAPHGLPLENFEDVFVFQEQPDNLYGEEKVENLAF